MFVKIFSLFIITCTKICIIEKLLNFDAFTDKYRFLDNKNTDLLLIRIQAYLQIKTDASYLLIQASVSLLDNLGRAKYVLNVYVVLTEIISLSSYLMISDQFFEVPVKIFFTFSLVISDNVLFLLTITASPSVAIVVSLSPLAFSLSFTALEAIPISQIPLIAEVIPVVESLS